MKKHQPLYIAWTFLTVLLLYSWYRIAALTGGHFCYSLDDAFIHMAVAKNLGLHGVWGITPDAFGSASSSPLYTVLLASLFRIGVNSYLAGLWINIIAAYGVLYTVHRILLKYGLPAIGETIVLFSLIVLFPFTVIILTGMEHLLHFWFALLFIQGVVEMISAEYINTRKLLLVSLWGALMVATRFEGLFILGAACLLLLFYRKIIAAFTTGFVAALPVVIFAVISVAYGGYILPNSVLLKSSGGPAGPGALGHALQEIFIYRLMYGNSTIMGLFQADKAYTGQSSISGTSLLRILIIVPLLVVLVKTKVSNTARQAVNMGIILSIGGALHLALAAVGWMFRYEAYLIGLAIINIALLLWCLWPGVTGLYSSSIWPQRLVMVILLFFVASPLLVRAMAGYRSTYRACRNIYDQQVQMGRFLQQYYPGVPVAANDVGAVSFLSDSRIVDIWGLGNNEIAKSKLTGHYNATYLKELLKRENVKIAIIYPDWYDNALYHSWAETGSWTIQDNVVCADPTVRFFALDSADAPALKRNLEAFQAQLPGTVNVGYGMYRKIAEK
ncbi:hypothetical protein [Chitinophaga sp. Cy-1792]|uniref:hypothetical protein n=1 Tax=Chitinophaga sp. Cy-1792 TaxID=2608339 RepID=UPI00141FF550|nr:hypothetical protein [Chitinophaga sp. Cy-1792]NIG56322.1 hypothetical protein [Chitinophaga sp. Cy-1792]